MPNITGVVQKINSRAVTTAYGNKTAYSVQVDGEWYSAGFKRPTVNDGDTVEVSYKMNGTYRNADSIVKVETTGAPAPVGVPSKSTGGYSPRIEKVFPIPPLHPDRSIVRQSALKAAVEVIGPFREGLDATDYIILARKFEAYSCGDLDAAAAASDIEVGGM
jgi:hypothetical protein